MKEMDEERKRCISSNITNSSFQVWGEWRHDRSSGMLGCWPLDHALTILSTIVNPVSAREDFLHHIRHTALPSGGSGEGGGGQEGADNVWVVVDSSGEEEEDPAKLWAAFTENDVIQVGCTFYFLVMHSLYPFLITCNIVKELFK